MSKAKSAVDFVESSAGSCRSTTRKETPGSMQFRWGTNREKSGVFNESVRQDSVAGLDRMEKSIWDLTESVKEDHSPRRSLLLRWTWSRVKRDARTLGVTVRKHPLVAVMPLLVWMLMLGGGIYAVMSAAQQETQHRRELANQIASDKAMFLATELAKVFMPAYVCSVYVRRDPNWAAVNGSFAPMALEMIRLSNAGSILTLSLIPNGVIYTMVPLKGSTPSDDANWKAIGKDWLQDKFNEDKVLSAINTTNLTIIGPYNLTQGGIGLVAMLSIRIPGASPNDTFNTPPYVHGALGPWQTPPRVQTGPNTTGTPFAPYMYTYGTTGSKWWGLTTVLISWDILRETVMRLQDLEALSYRYVLSRPALQKELLRARPDLANGTAHELAVAWSANVQPVPAEATNNGAKPTRPGEARPLIYYDLHEQLDEPAIAHVSVEGAEMMLYLEPVGGWTPGWRDPLLVVVAVGSMLVGLMLFTILLNRRLHIGLLHSMIPKKVISTISRGDIFTESFNCVTILFSDIVSYTSMSAHMAPIEVVQMLDELYTEYDKLTEKHQLYKVETIGDAFMLVGGAPETLDPVDAARRVAQMAIDMVQLTRTRVLAGGQNLRIRVGIHSGPVVAAVVGKKMPRYCLFGDTVNTASRMESNGSPMRIHVSGATADLLRQAGGFVLEPRGEIPIKGKGSMKTFWVQGLVAERSASDAASLQDASVSVSQRHHHQQQQQEQQQPDPPRGKSPLGRDSDVSPSAPPPPALLLPALQSSDGGPHGQSDSQLKNLNELLREVRMSEGPMEQDPPALQPPYVPPQPRQLMLLPTGGAEAAAATTAAPPAAAGQQPQQGTVLQLSRLQRTPSPLRYCQVFRSDMDPVPENSRDPDGGSPRVLLQPQRSLLAAGNSPSIRASSSQIIPTIESSTIGPGSSFIRTGSST